ncbi:MAG: putative PurR-regulated permease PerM [Methylophilaceae bacterium]|jgi:predicted PurR-regulated permease PerM|tara:strand:- start:840 stop:1856 length:1017 start_codon:yes stop_codon:yes gene_type:complete
MKINAVTKIEIAAWLIMAAAMLYVLNYNLLPGLLAGLLVFELVHIISPYIAKKFPGLGYFSKVIAIGLLAAFIVGLLTLVVLGLIAFFKSNSGSLTNLIGKMAQIIEDSRSILPDWIDSRLPADAVVLQQMVTEWLRNNASSLQFLGKEAGRYVAHMIIAMIVGGMLALREVMTEDHYKPFAKAMVQRVRLFGCAFRNIVFAQVRISTINTVFTGIYLAIILPSAGVDLPFVKTMIMITFIIGLLPVVGNLISNTVIVIVSMSHSFGVALGSLLFLVIIHKFEYFLNARIVGGQIRANAWELLIAMVLMEAAFGIAGVVAAPIYYAYIKSELRERELI